MGEVSLIQVYGELKGMSEKLDTFCEQQMAMNRKLFERSDDHNTRLTVIETNKKNDDENAEKAEKKRNRFLDAVIAIFGLSIGGTIIHWLEKLFPWMHT